MSGSRRTATHRRVTRPGRESRARKPPVVSLASALCDLCVLFALGLLAFGPWRREGA
jgi:hypothetical protein